MAKKKPSPSPRFRQIFDAVNSEPINVWTWDGRPTPTPMGMPHNVVIYGQHYRVLYCTNIYYKPKKNARLSGVVVYQNRLIVIDPAQTIYELKETLFHEMYHVYMKVAQQQSENLSKLTYSQVEELCNLFGSAVYDLALNNPVLK